MLGKEQKIDTKSQLFKYCIDSPSANTEINDYLIRVSGWIITEKNNVIEQPEIGDSSESFIQQLYKVSRPDVKAAYPKHQVLGFNNYISIFDINQLSSLSIRFVLNGKKFSIPLYFKLSTNLKKINNQKKNKLKKIRNCLRCPQCKSEDLADLRNYLECNNCHSKFEFNSKNYNFLTAELKQHARVKSTDNISSHAYGPPSLELIKQFSDGLILDNGCGLRSVYYDNVINFEIVDYPTTDVLGIGENLPFKSNSFDAVFSLAVLEHVRNPFECAQEIIRVLKPGGKLYAVVPFLQPFHGYPDHYYNMTSSGIKNLFEESLQIIDCGVPSSGLPIWCLSWFLNSYIRGLSSQAAQKFKNMKVSDLINHPSSYLKEEFVTQLNASTNQELACTNYLLATKKTM